MESGKGQAEKQEKRDGFDNIPKYNVSIISDGTADREKEHEGSAAGETHLPDIPHSSINGIYRLTGTRYDFFQFFSDSALA